MAAWADSNGSAAALDSPPLVLGQGFVIPATVALTTPEPSTLTLVGIGLACIGVIRTRRRAGKS